MKAKYIDERLLKQPLSDEKSHACDTHYHAHTDEVDHGHTHHEHSHENHWIKAGIGLASGIGLLTLSVLGLPLGWLLQMLITGFSSLLTLYLGRTIYQSTWKTLKKRQWDTSLLYSISTLTIFTLSLASLFIPGAPIILESATLILGFWHLGEGLEHSVLQKINKKLDIRDCAPAMVKLKPSNQEVPITALKPGDIIEITEGNTVPVDGKMLDEASLFTARVDGSPSLKKFVKDADIKAGMLLPNDAHPFKMLVTEAFENSYLSLIAKNLQHANDEKAPIELLTNKILRYFIPGLLTIAVTAGLSIALIFNLSLAIQCVTSVLVSACPCALSLITPLAVKIGMAKAAEHGIHFKNGKALQTTPDIDTLVFDLNGTLTKGEMSLAFKVTDPTCLNAVAHLEKNARHPIGKAIFSFLQKKGHMTNEAIDVHSVDNSHHAGITGVVNGIRYVIGNIHFLAANGIESIHAPYNNPDNGNTYIVRDNKIVGQIALVDPLRYDAIVTIQALKKLGKSIHICTGADINTAQKYANELDIPIENVCANAMAVPTDASEISKTGYIKKLQKRGSKVAMIGDAANDLVALDVSDLGIAVKSTIGDSITEEHAGIVLQQGSLLPIATAFNVAHKTKRNILQNLFLSLTYNSAVTLVASGLFIALGLTLSPSLGVALTVLESTVILGNLARFRHQSIQAFKSANVSIAKVVQEPEETTSALLKQLSTQPQDHCGSAPTLSVSNHACSHAQFTLLSPAKTLAKGPESEKQCDDSKHPPLLQNV
ncbi:MAG: cation-translocating P-type ATPase [Legionella sp.]|nr:cation-translocating P-type ATPase [Legionella sp.]